MQSIITGFDSAMDSVKGFISALIEPLTVFLNVFSDFWLGTILITAVFAAMLLISVRRYGSEFTAIIRKPQTLALCAMLIAVNVVLGYFIITISPYIRIGFGFVTVPVVSMMFGPIVGCCMGVMQDLIGFIIKPTGGLLINLTLNAGLTGIIYAAMLYRKKISFLRVLAAQLIIIIVVNIVLNSIALAPTVASGMVGILPSRIIKNIILLPVQSVIIYIILKAVQMQIMSKK